MIAALKEIAGGIVVGAWNAQPEPFMGPLVREHAAVQAEDYVNGLLARGGEAIEPLVRDGAFVRPTIVDMTAAQGSQDEELFGPVLQVWRARTFDEALDLANARRASGSLAASSLTMRNCGSARASNCARAC